MFFMYICICAHDEIMKRWNNEIWTLYVYVDIRKWMIHNYIIQWMLLLTRISDDEVLEQHYRTITTMSTLYNTLPVIYIYIIKLINYIYV